MPKCNVSKRTFLIEKLLESNIIAVAKEVCVGCRICELMCSLHHKLASFASFIITS